MTDEAQRDSLGEEEQQESKPIAQVSTRIDLGYKPGTSIGNYHILSTLGEGGFGVVYLAEQTKPLKRRVALKVIKPGMDSKRVIARFEAERQALALMDHPNVAHVFDGGTTEDGRPYFVMENVKGESITLHCDRQSLPILERLYLFMKVCDAVQHAHQKGIIHRDIKPSNILIEYEGGKATPKVIDFGVAKALDQKLTEATIFTEQGQLIGTPEYMSPEQAEMSATDIDTRSDIYSLGVLLYELLTGTLPFDPESLRAAGLAEIQRIIREVEPEKPSTRIQHSSTTKTRNEEESSGYVESESSVEDIARHRKSDPPSLARTVRGDLDWIVMKCLEKDRERRYDAATDLAKEIDRYLNNEPVLAGPPSAMYRVKKFVKRHQVGIAVVSLFATIIVSASIATSIGFFWAISERERADLNAQSANASALAAIAAKEEALTAKERAQQAELEAKNRADKLLSVYVSMEQGGLALAHKAISWIKPGTSVSDEEILDFLVRESWHWLEEARNIVRDEDHVFLVQAWWELGDKLAHANLKWHQLDYVFWSYEEAIGLANKIYEDTGDGSLTIELHQRYAWSIEELDERGSRSWRDGLNYARWAIDIFEETESIKDERPLTLNIAALSVYETASIAAIYGIESDDGNHIDEYSNLLKLSLTYFAECQERLNNWKSRVQNENGEWQDARHAQSFENWESSLSNLKNRIDTATLKVDKHQDKSNEDDDSDSSGE